MKEYIIKETTFSDLFSLGRNYLFVDFLDSLKEEIENDNIVIIEKSNGGERIIIKTLKELEEYKKIFSL
jgi:hypothetical protein